MSKGKRKVKMQTQIFDMLMEGDAIENTNSMLARQSLTNIINRIKMKGVDVSDNGAGCYFLTDVEIIRVKREGINV